MSKQSYFCKKYLLKNINQIVLIDINIGITILTSKTYWLLYWVFQPTVVHHCVSIKLRVAQKPKYRDVLHICLFSKYHVNIVIWFDFSFVFVYCLQHTVIYLSFALCMLLSMIARGGFKETGHIEKLSFALKIFSSLPLRNKKAAQTEPLLHFNVPPPSSGLCGLFQLSPSSVF